MRLETVSLDPPALSYVHDEQRLIYRVGSSLFSRVVDAENYKLDATTYVVKRAPIELWYKDRWNIMGDIPEASRVAL